MGRSRPSRPAPLPVRDGIDPVLVVVPRDAPTDPPGHPGTVLARLQARFPDAADRLAEMVAGGEVVDHAGTPVDAGTRAEDCDRVWYYRDLPEEAPAPDDLPVLYEDPWVLAVDKPHGLATTPRGGHVAQTALVKLRRARPDQPLSPAHRLDKDTAGVLLLVKDPAARGPVQTLFERGEAEKTYEAVAAHAPALDLPRTVTSRIVKERGVLQAREEPGAPNARSTVALDAVDPEHGTARYRLVPHTGKTHQLRVHMNALGVPILHDPLYPVVLPPDLRRPTMRLLSRSLTFGHPMTGTTTTITSKRRMSTTP